MYAYLRVKGEGEVFMGRVRSEGYLRERVVEGEARQCRVKTDQVVLCNKDAANEGERSLINPQPSQTNDAT